MLNISDTTAVVEPTADSDSSPSFFSDNYNVDQVIRLLEQTAKQNRQTEQEHKPDYASFC